jgi:hypothetical protein
LLGSRLGDIVPPFADIEDEIKGCGADSTASSRRFAELGQARRREN